MGDPRRLRKKYHTPTNPFEKDRILEEMRYLGRYGLRNKKEFWKHRSQLSTYRRLAREARASPEKTQELQLKEIRSKLSMWGLVRKDANFDDILSLTIDRFLDRRLQTIVYKRGLAKTISQARQLITHGHIAMGEKVVDSPSYLVPLEDEPNINFAKNSSFYNQNQKIWGDQTPNVVSDVSAKEIEEIKQMNKKKAHSRRGGEGRGRRGRDRRAPKESEEEEKEAEGKTSEEPKDSEK